MVKSGNREKTKEEFDPLADQNLIRFTLREIILLQAAAAAMFGFDFVVKGFAVSIFFLPLVLATWAAYRLRKFPYLTLINPFTIAIVSNYVLFLIVYVVEFFGLSKGPPVLFSRELQGARETLIWGPPFIGVMEGFLALFLAKAIAVFTDR